MKTKEYKSIKKGLTSDQDLPRKVKDFLIEVNQLEKQRSGKQRHKNAYRSFAELPETVMTAHAGIEESEKLINAFGQSIKLNIVRPAGVNEHLPAFIFVHGGGWTSGDYQTHQRLVRDIVDLSQCAAVFVNYSLSPEAIFPLAIDEIFVAAQWIAKNGAELQLDGENLAIIGNSFGGNMAAVTALMAKEKPGPKFRVQILLWPVISAKINRAAVKLCSGRYLTASLLKAQFSAYVPDKKLWKEPYVSPLGAKNKLLRHLPPTLIVLAQNDLSRYAAQAYANKLADADVPVTVVRFNGMIHDFARLSAFAELPETNSAIALIASTLKKYLRPV